ncbi:MAG: superoxide dismutase [Chitinivibrionales bacterium]|nr:superoxide dismutase [Chitinivibrionales bacterium]
MKSFRIPAVLSLVFGLLSVNAFSHCEIPCGIYDDHARIHLMREHVTTIEKSMKKIDEVSSAKEINHNQLVRWVTNKERHAEKLQEIAWQYFMTQRIKLADDKDEKAVKDYNHKLGLLHQILIYAMKAKQTTDLLNVEKLNEAIAQFEKAYMPKK